MSAIAAGVANRRFALAVALLCVLPTVCSPALARDDGQWEATDGQIRAWYRELMQPDNPRVSCCGEADAYYADSYQSADCTLVADEENPFPQKEACYLAIITDTRDDAPLGRPHIPAGTKVKVPNVKLKYDRGNPTGHGVIFVNTTLDVLCYIVPGGV
jgi:hypothetical protein